MPLLDESASGVYTIAATPFLPDGALDLESIDRMVDHYVACGATGLTILGMMGEAGKLTASESLLVIRRVVARTDLPVVVGVSNPGFAQIVGLATDAMDAGAVGVMVAPPWTVRTDAQITQYFRTVAEMLGPIPWVLQDFPVATQVQISPSVILDIAASCPTMVMLKHEDWPGLEKISTLRRAEADGARRISILCGNAGLYLPEELQRGADGAMTGFAYPEMMGSVVAAYRAGEMDRMQDLFDAYLPLIRYESQPGLGLAIRKYILARNGAIAHPTVRKPGPALSNTAIAEIERLISRQEARLASLDAPG